MSRTIRPVRKWTKATAASCSRLDHGHALHPDLCGTHEQMGLDSPSRIPFDAPRDPPFRG